MNHICKYESHFLNKYNKLQDS